MAPATGGRRRFGDATQRPRRQNDLLFEAGGRRASLRKRVNGRLTAIVAELRASLRRRLTSAAAKAKRTAVQSMGMAGERDDAAD
ncbi:MAG: hypothetical protein ACLPN5_16740 [Roseiarcus sp.]